MRTPFLVPEISHGSQRNSIRVPPDESGPRPPRSPAEQRLFEEKKREIEEANASKSRLIEAGEKAHNLPVKLPKMAKQRTLPGIVSEPSAVDPSSRSVRQILKKGRSRAVAVEVLPRNSNKLGI